MKQKGFTLIELLAVIVILAIIALIATPIILGIIKNSKEQSIMRSAELYIDAVEQAIVRKNLEVEYNPQECIIVGGQLNCAGKTLEVQIEGEVPEDYTIIKLKNGKAISGSKLIFKQAEVNINDKGEMKIDPITKNETITPQEGPEHLAKKNVRAVTTPTTGIVPIIDSNGNIVSGSEFKIKVSDNIKDANGEIIEYTFFVLSNDGDYVNLIAQQNITPDGKFTSEPQDGDEWYISGSFTSTNQQGPLKAYEYLSNATNNWTNIPIIQDFYNEDEGFKEDINACGYQSIKTELDKQTGKYITTITPRSQSTITYENMKSRLPYYNEIIENTDCKESETGSCPIWMVNYLFSNSSSEEYYNHLNHKVGSSGKNFAFWTLSTACNDSYQNVYYVIYLGRLQSVQTTNVASGVRPVITILKSDLLRVMNK